MYNSVIFKITPNMSWCDLTYSKILKMYIFGVTVIQNNRILTDTHNIREYYDTIFGCVLNNSFCC